jgi:F0F1-type ATP synthase assembly protein I
MAYNLFDEDDSQAGNDERGPAGQLADPPVVSLPFDPPSLDESVRRSGLAWSAGIVFFGSTAFMLGLGWLADLILGSRPWGLVGGIVLGAIIGFVQFFRITSQIYKSDKSEKEIHPLFSESRDDQQ